LQRCENRDFPFFPESREGNFSEFFKKTAEKQLRYLKEYGIIYGYLETAVCSVKRKSKKDETEMLDFVNLLLPTKSDALYNLYMGLSVTMIALMCLAAIAAIILVLLQPGNSTGIDALGGSSETFFGKNKGKSIESRMKKWTVICLVVLVIFSICFYILQLESIWA